MIAVVFCTLWKLIELLIRLLLWVVLLPFKVLARITRAIAGGNGKRK